jgi:ferrochelatase
MNDDINQNKAASDCSKKIAVVLFNLGGPDKKQSIKPFLFNFFMDKNIIRAPIFVRYFLAKLISIRRTKREAGESYGELGDKSPLLENSNEQAIALEKFLNLEECGQFKTFICMRYWHPMADEISKDVQAFNPDEIILLPLYPQFSTTTTRSSIQAWDKAIKSIKLDKPTTTICCYPWEDGFVEASAENIKAIYAKALEETGKTPRVLLSAHGLPEKIITEGDPYQWQCEQSAAKIAYATKIENLDWQICYQSRVGPLKWIGPSTEEALKRAAKDNVPVVILPHAFTQEHVETLVEIEIEYRELAEEMGLHEFYRVPTVGTSAAFIEGLADLVLNNMGKNKTLSMEGKSLCPKGFKDCCVRQSEGAA